MSQFLLRHMAKRHSQEKVALKFVTCKLVPPPKRAVLAYLGIPLRPGSTPEPPSAIVRRAEVDVTNIKTSKSIYH